MICRFARTPIVLYCLFLHTGLVSQSTWAADPVVVSIDLSDRGPRVNPRMYGIFLEEINHGIDGGLYAELVRNRGFEDSRPPEGYQLDGEHYVDEGGFRAGYDEFGYSKQEIPFWKTWPLGSSSGKVTLQREGGVSEASSYCVKLTADQPTDIGFGLVNEGFFGIGVQQDREYQASLYMKAEDYNGKVTIQLLGPENQPLSAKLQFDAIRENWQKFTGKLIATQTAAKAKLVVLLDTSGTVELDFVSLMPAKTWRNEPNGLRADIAQMIADLQPGFVRFPGGCVVEGGTIETAYNWKWTVGSVEDRQERWGPWNHRRTNGMGIFEYLRFCENLGAEPLWVGFCGQTCIFRNREHVPMSDMEWVRDGFLDLIEYANGAPDTTWGAIRAEAGREESFDLKYVEIGNENQGREYSERYQYVHQSLAEKYPDLTYLGDLSWTSPQSMEGSDMDIIDRHYYSSSNWFVTQNTMYDDRSRDLPPLYLGEVAVTSGEAGPLRGNMRAALAEGVFLLGCERNADAVSMVSYAPLLANVSGRTALTGAPPPWHAMIYFDGTRVFGTASYYLWQLFGQNRPDAMVATSITTPGAKPAKIAGQIGIGTWDAAAEFKNITVELPDGEKWTPQALTDNQRGRWTQEDDVFRQQRRGRGLTYFGESDWSSYTLTLKARKQEGGEGFLIVFGRQDGSQFWWNLGGWGNSQHAIEHNQNLVGQGKRGNIESDRWYDIKVDLEGDRIRCYLDDELVHDERFVQPSQFFAETGIDEGNGDAIIKAINLSNQPQQATLKLSGEDNLGDTGKLMVLAANRPNENNSLEQPHKIVPKNESITIHDGTLEHKFPANSCTVIRVPLSSNLK